MTTIATDGAVMAADGLLTDHQTIIDEHCRKMRLADDGRCVGLAGNPYCFDGIMAWINGGERPALTEDDDITLIVLDANGGVVETNWTLRFVSVTPPIAVGSGSGFALAAMDLGFSPARAVEVAARRDIGTGGEIFTMVPDAVA